MYAELIKGQVEAGAKRMIEAHPAVRRALSGHVSAAAVESYLQSLHYVVRHTVPHLTVAQAAAEARGHRPLADFFAGKRKEEAGHEKWAEDDLAAYGATAPSATAPVLPAARELVSFLASLAKDEPALYSVYILTNEYFTVLAGPAWVEALSRHCGVPIAAMSAITKHVELDRAHAAAGLRTVDEFIAEPEMLPSVSQTVQRSLSLFDALFQQLAQAN